MKNLKGSEIRQLWLKFFSEKGHEVIPSASLVPHDDPTLLWINAGVAPLKKYFDGREKPSNPRMCNAQKSIRTNDIDNVGKTARHHTFFEMLGNFSIGDYFRDEVIPWAVELLFDEKWYGFSKENIYITYYPEDLDTYNKWVSCGIDPSHLVKIADNFWEIGEGPCGPDTEIFYDRGEKYDEKHLGIKMLAEDIENDRYIEIWNIVFSQFNSVTGLPREQYPELPSKNIDTGSGLERLACIFQQTETNYETDLFLPYIRFVEQYSGKKYEDNKMAFRVISDHIRSVTFAVADGAMLSNEGRGYVLRRILRRAVRYGRKLGIHDTFLYKMVSLVVDNMKDFYPYLVEKQNIVEQVIKKEEENFLKTLELGEKKISEVIKMCLDKKLDTVSAKDAFLLYDTFGFPIELTLESSEEAGLKVDIDGFQVELNAQKARARAARSDSQSMNAQNEDYLNYKEASKFIGYDVLEASSKVIGLFKDGKSVKSASGELIAVLDQTPFYAEMGGQVGDIGELIYNGSNIKVLNTFKLPNGQHAHVCDSGDLVIKLTDKVTAIVDEAFRMSVCSNHSGTHLLNESLRKVLGNHVVQHGSYVSDERLRFDFNHYTNITNENLLEIERLTNKAINDSYNVEIKEMPIEEAKKTGAQALFGEKYGDIVRVVNMNYSIEFCGGTHVHNTSDIKKLAILSIESKGSGIFRLEALTGENVNELMSNYLAPLKNDIINVISKINEVIQKAASEGCILNKPNINLPSIVGSYQDTLNYKATLDEAREALKEAEKAYDTYHRENSSKNYKQYLDNLIIINNKNVIVEKVDKVEIDVLKDVVDKLSAELDNCVVFMADVISSEKIIFVCKSKVSGVHAGNLVKAAAVVCGGNGGGRPDFAQAGGKDASRIDDALNKVKESL